MEKLKTTSRTTEVDAISKAIIANHDNSVIEDDNHLNEIINEMRPLSVKLNEAVMRHKADSELDEKDQKLDGDFRNLYYLILGFTHHPDATINAAAQTVMKILNNYGLETINKSYLTETSLISSMLTELKNTEIAESITLLSGATESIDTLGASLDDFNQSFLLNKDIKSKENQMDNATEYKKEMVKLINGKLIIYLNAMVLVNNQVYGEYANKTAQIIEDLNTIIKRRTKKPLLESIK